MCSDGLLEQPLRLVAVAGGCFDLRLHHQRFLVVRRVLQRGIGQRPCLVQVAGLRRELRLQQQPSRIRRVFRERRADEVFRATRIALRGRRGSERDADLDARGRRAELPVADLRRKLLEFPLRRERARKQRVSLVFGRTRDDRLAHLRFRAHGVARFHQRRRQQKARLAVVGLPSAARS